MVSVRPTHPDFTDVITTKLIMSAFALRIDIGSVLRPFFRDRVE